jgi:hypothetical protein
LRNFESSRYVYNRSILVTWTICLVLFACTHTGTNSVDKFRNLVYTASYVDVIISETMFKIP